MRRHPLLAYFVLAYAITWLAVLPLVLGTSVPPAWHGLGALGPLLAAIIVTARLQGRSRLRDLWDRTTRFRGGSGWLAITVASPFVLFAIAALMAPPDIRSLTPRLFEPAFWLDLGVASLVYGFCEEVGWRGFALPRLQQRHSAFTATLILAGVWAAWHAPFFAYRFTFTGIFAIAGFVMTLFAGALWLTFLYNSTGGSVMAVALWHTLWNLLNVSLGSVAQQTVTVANILMFPLAVLVVWLGTPRRLCWSPRRRAMKGDPNLINLQ